MALAPSGGPRRRRRRSVSNPSEKTRKSKLANISNSSLSSLQVARHPPWLSEETRAYLNGVAPRPWRERLREQSPVVLLIALGLGGSLHQAINSFDYVWTHAQVHHAVFFAFVGVYVADLVTGLGHMVLDHTVIDAVPAKERTWLQWLAYGFQLHHANPSNWRHDDLLSHGILRTGFAILVVLLGAHAACLAAGRVPECTKIGWFSLEFVGLTTQVYHAAAHGRWRENRVVRKLQAWGWILPPSDHALHHQRFDVNFAIATGWSNPLLNWFYMYFFRRFVHSDMRAEVQRVVYIDHRSELSFPFPEIFPALRSHTYQ